MPNPRNPYSDSLLADALLGSLSNAESLARGFAVAPIGLLGDINALGREYITPRLPSQIQSLLETSPSAPTTEQILANIPRASKKRMETSGMEQLGAVMNPMGPIELVGAGARGAEAGLMAAGRAGERYAEKVVPQIMERGGLPAQLLGDLSQGSMSQMAASSKQFKFPQEKAMDLAQQRAALPVEQGGLGLLANNTADERAAAMGASDWFHGTDRLDRLLEKKNIDARRATSGPMPYGTNDPTLASGYSMNKADTSRIANDMGEMQNYFQVFPKSMGERGTSPYSVEQTWFRLPQEKKAEILEKAKRVGFENFDESSGPLKLHPEGTNAMNVSEDTWNYYLNRESKGNPLTALRKLWAESGMLYGDEEKLADIYKLAGFPYEISQTNAPWTSAKGVMTGKAMISNPLDTSNVSELQEKVIPFLKEQFKNDRSRTKAYGADNWDKNTKYTPKQWVDELEKDIGAGENSYVWTSIPDKITNALKQAGYNGIIDKSGKGGGQVSDVIIPFEPEQMRSRFAAFDPFRRTAAIAAAMGVAAPDLLAQESQNQNLLYRTEDMKPNANNYGLDEDLRNLLYKTNETATYRNLLGY